MNAIVPTSHDTQNLLTARSRLLFNDYQRDGVVGPIDVISVREATDIMNTFLVDPNIFPLPPTTCTTNHNLSVEVSQPQPQHHNIQYNQRNTNLFKTYLFVPYINQLVRHPNLIRAVQTVLQTNDVRCWSCDFNLRYRDTPIMIAPHQDSTYAGLIPAEDVVTAWIALSDPVTVQQGGLQFYLGSHLLGQLPHSTTNDNTNDDDTDINDVDAEKCNSDGCRSKRPTLRNALSRNQRCAVPNGMTGTSIPLRAGQATLHHFYTVHSSGPNLSTDASSSVPRIGLAIRYISATVRKRHYIVKETITHISGCTDLLHDDCFESWEPILPTHPTQHDIDIGKASHAIAMERETTNYFAQPNK
jgi:ectoine hydroxylase-related dioxygenase (phytanoyl-CoA dioxygenase family)